MPFHRSKIILIILAAAILLLGFASVASYSKPLTPNSITGPGGVTGSPATGSGGGAGNTGDDASAKGDLSGIQSTFFGLALTRPIVEPAPAPVPQPRKKFAIVIGINYNNSILGTVHYADQDAASMYHLLTAGLGFPAENIRLLRNGDATRANIISSLDWLSHSAGVDANSDVVFFYSGHGLRSLPGLGLNIPGAAAAYTLVPFDFYQFDYKSGLGLIGDTELATYLGNINPGRMWVNIDSCFSGGFDRAGISGPNRVVTMSSQSDQLSGEMPGVERGTMMENMIEEGVAKGASIEEAFNAAAPRAHAISGQDPRIADDYPGNMNLWETP